MALHHQEPITTTYIFGPFRFVPQRQLLLRHGYPVRIGGRALDILGLPVRRAGDVVTKHELLIHCWPSTHVEESNLKVNVASLRRILAGDEQKTYIATVTGRGYTFIADVVLERAEPPPHKTVATQAKPILKPADIIGRTEEIADLAEKLRTGRCLTIVGPGGMGKTTVALALANQAVDLYPRGVFFIDLSTVGDPQYTIAAIAAGVGARQRSEDTLLEIVELLHDRHTLLVFDNCEHLSPMLPSIIERLLHSLPTVRVLATSREPLHIDGEQIHRLPNLSVPGLSQGDTAKDALRFSAVRLFVARASAREAFVLTNAEAHQVSAICRRLDGIPLAIELVASKTFTYGIPTLLEMLEQKFLFLTNGERTAPARQQTLLATLDWSYRLLSEDEAAFLRLMSVFAGTFSPSDAAAMADTIGFDLAGTVDSLERLISKSLICVEDQTSGPTYRLLEITRAFAWDRLRDAGELEEALERHARQTLELLERSVDEVDNREKREWMAEYGHRVDDARNAMTWAFGDGANHLLGIRLTAAAIPLWNELSSLNEMQSRVERALLAARDMRDCPKDLMMKLIAARASGMTFAPYLALDTEAAWKECYELGVESANLKYQLFGLWGLCSYLIYTGRPIEGLARLQSFIALAKSGSDWSAVDEAHRMVATAKIYVGEIAESRQILERLVGQQNRVSDPVKFARFQAERGVAVRCSLSLVLWISGEASRAVRVARSAVERAEASGHIVSHSNALAIFAIPIAFWSGDYASVDDFLLAIEENGRSEDIGVWREVCLFYKTALRAKRQEPGAAVELKSRLRELIEARHLLRVAMHYSMVAEALLEVDALDDARELIVAARTLAVQQHAHWCLPEIMRVAAMLELRSQNPQVAERLLMESIEKASAIGALTFELSTTLSLTAKWQSEGRWDDALDLLGAVCAKFPKEEAFAELVLARSMLRTLNRPGKSVKVLL